MKVSNWFYIFFSFILFLLFIAPFIYISQYLFLSADDYCRAHLNFQSFGINFKEWYNFHNGRYINAIFSLLPVYNLSVYRVIMASQFILLGYVLYNFVCTMFSLYKMEIRRSKVFFISILLYIVIIAQLPSLFEFFYWYAAMTVYLLSFIFFTLFLKFVLLFYFNRELKFFPIALLIVLINGNNELFLGLTNFLILILLVWDFVKHQRLNKKLIILNILSWISSLAVVLSPGSISRRGHYDYGSNFFDSLKVAITHSGKFIFNHFLELPIIFFYALVFIFIYQRVRNKGKKYINPLGLLLTSYFSIASIFFILYYAKGSLGVYTGRIGNIVSLVVFIFVLINILNLSLYLRLKSTYKKILLPCIPAALLVVFLGFLILKNENYLNLRKDFTDNNFVKYEEEMEKRYNLLQEAENDSIVLTPMRGTLIIKSDDPMIIKEKWLKSCYINYFNQGEKTNIRNLQIRNSIISDSL